MSVLIVGAAFFNEDGEYVRVVEILENGEPVLEVTETGHDYSYDHVVRDIPTPTKREVSILDDGIGYPREQIEKMSGY